MSKNIFLKSYGFSLILLGSIVVGSVAGWLLGAQATCLAPLGKVFLRLLYVCVVPLIFFSIASAVAGMSKVSRLLKVMAWMLVVFTITGVISSSIMAAVVHVFPLDANVMERPAVPAASDSRTAVDKVLDTFTVSDFPALLSKANVLPLVIFAVLVGLAAASVGDKGRAFRDFLASANEVFVKVISLIMYYAPLGLAACFAATIGELGPQFAGAFGKVVALYYPVCLVYFFVAFTAYAGLAGGGWGIKTFWKNAVPPSIMAAASGSSFATIPLNLEAADRVGVPREISEMVIPIGATIHMDGSCMAAIIKIAFLSALYGHGFTSPADIPMAIGVSILAGMVVSGVPGGGVTGELLIIAIYGYPAEAIAYTIVIGQIVDPPATLLNSVGDNVASMVVARLVNGRNWMQAKLRAAEPALELEEVSA